ncbi:hypothetical protein [Paenibacillus sp. 32O-W]|uniref:hypothetical protein n=1 Tax=Paenibacillus sp. 32O-W TaxID=1695218 RepID=UPI0011A20E40|nr:hypothetical protein [Paenibacillus sp. 32O-W]
MKKPFCLFVVMSLIVGLFSGTAVFAEKLDASTLASKGALVQTRAEFVGQSVIDYLQANDVTVDKDSIIEILPLAKSNNALAHSSYNTVLSVTNVENGKVYKDVLITYTEGSDGLLSVVDVPVNSRAGQSLSGEVQPFAGHTIEFPPDSWDDRLTIRGTAVYDIYYDSSGIFSYYSPYGVYFTYTKGSAKNVSYISVNYICEGGVYSYPGFESLGYTVSHSVKVSQSNPATNTMYHNTNYFDSNKVILLSGTPFAGNSMTFDFTVDGRSDGYTVYF